MAVFSYVGGSVSMATGSYGNLAIRKGSQVAQPNTITVSARSFTEGTPASGLFEPVERVLLNGRVKHTAGFSANKLSFNTTEPYNNGAYSTSAYYTPYNTVFQDLDYSSYNTESPSGEYWAHAYGFTNSEFGTAIAVDKKRNAWIVGTTDYCSATITSITASLTSTASFTNNSTTPNVGTNDSGYFSFGTLPFNHNIFGLNSQSLFVVSNSWISFDAAINTTQTAFSGTTPGWANIQIGAGEASCQRVYWGTFGTAPTRTFRVRYEGTNATTGVLGSPNMVWEFILYESNPDIFDIQIGAWTPPTTNANGISDGSTYFGTFTPAANTGWRFDTNIVGVAAGNNVTLVKYSTKGQFQTDKDFATTTSGTGDLTVHYIGRNGNETGEAIKIGSDGRIYILYSSNSIGYQAGVAVNDIGIIKVDPDYLYTASTAAGGILWAKTFGTTTTDTGASIDIDANDNLYIVGFTQGSGQGSNDVVALKVDSSGNIIWKKTYGATLSDVGTSVRVDKDNNIFIWGYGASTPLVGTPNDYFLLKVNGTTGSLIWQKHFNISATTGAQNFENSIDVDPFGNVYVNGYSSTSPNAYFVAKLDTNGNFVWSRSVGAVTANPDAGTSVKYRNGFIYVSGQDSSTTTSGEGYGLGVSKIDAITGQLVSNYVVGGVATEFAYAIDIDNYGDIYATGAVATSMTGLTSATGTNAFVTKFILDTPQGGFTIGGGASRVWSSTTGIKRYTSGKEYFDAQAIVFQNDLLLTGHQSIFGLLPTTEKVFSISEALSGSGTLLTFNPDEQTLTPILTRSGLVNGSISIFTQSGVLYNNVSDTILLQNSDIIALSTTSINVIPGFRASARVTWNPVDTTQLFDVSGTASAKTTAALFVTSNNILDQLLASSTFETNNWNKNNISVIGNTISGLDGTLTADKLVENTANAQHFVSFSKFGFNETITFSVFAKAAERSQVFLQLSNFVNATAQATYNLATGTAGAPSSNNADYTNISTSIVPYPNGWYRCILTATKGSVNTTNAPTISISNSAVTYTGDGTSGIYVWGAKVERGSVATPYITENGALLTDNFINASGNVSEIISNKLSGSGSTTFSGTVSESQTDITSGSGSISSSSVNVTALVSFNGGVGAPSTQLFTIGSGYTSTKTNFTYLKPNSNLIVRPENFLAAAWSIGGGQGFPTRTKDQLAPDQSFTAWTLDDTSTGADGQGIDYDISITPSSTKTYCVSVFAKQGTAAKFDFYVFFTGIAVRGTRFSYTWANDTITTNGSDGGGADVISKGRYALPNGWYRFWFVVSDSTLGTNNILKYRLYPASRDTGPVGSTIFWGAKVEEGLAPSPYLAESGIEISENYITSSGNAGSKAPNRFIGSSPVEYYNAGQVAFEDGENFRASEFKADTTAFYRFQKGAFGGTGSITSGDEAFKSTTNVAFIPLNTLLIYNTNVFTKIAMQYAGKSPTTPFGGLEIVFEELEANAPPQEFKYTGSGSTPSVAFKWVGIASDITITGTAVEKSTDANAVSGSITTGFTAEAKVSFRPFDATDSDPLFSILGQHGTRVFVPSWPASGTINITGAATQPPVNYSWAGSSPIEYFNAGEIVFEDGENFRASEFKYDSTSLYRFQKGTFSGTGSITADPNASAAVIFNPPDEAAGVQLFNITGAYSNLRSTSINVITEAPLFTSAAGSASVVFNPPDTSAETQLFTVTGSLVEKYTKGLYTGDGYINSSDFGSAIVTFKPTDGTGLFTFTNGYSNFGFSSFNVSNYSRNLFANPESLEFTVWQKNSTTVSTDAVSALDKTLTAEKLIGNLNVTGRQSIRQDVSVVSGTRYTFSVFLKAAGRKYATIWFDHSSSELLDGNYIGAGNVIDLETGTVFTPTQVVTKTIPYPNGWYRVYVSATPTFTGNLRLQIGIGTPNNLNEPPVYNDYKYIGDGSSGIYVWGAQFEASSTLSPYVSIAGKVFSEGSGTNITASGNAITRSPNRHIGSSPVEYYNPNQVAFEDGENFGASEFKADTTAFYRFQNATFNGSGSITTDPNASATVSYNPPDEAAAVQLFNVTGASDLKFIERIPADASPLTVFISGAASDEKQIDIASGSGSTSITGTLVEKQTEVASGSGTLFSASGAAEAFGVNPVDTTQLFDVSGSYSDLRSTFNSAPLGGTISISGGATEPPREIKYIGLSPTAYFNPDDIVFGNEEDGIPTEYRNTSTALYRSQFVDSGSGSITTGNLGSAAVIFNPPDEAAGVQLFTISGSYSNLQFISQAGEAPILFQISGAATQIASGYAWIGLSPLTYFSAGQIVFEEGENFGASEFKYDTTASYRFQNATFSGSGSITTDPNASATVSYNPPDEAAAVQLFTVSGQHGTRVFVPSWPASGSTTLSGSGSQSIQYANFTGNSPSAYIDPYQVVFGEEENYGSTDISLFGYSRFSATPTTEVGSGALFSDGFFSNLKAIFRPFDATDSDPLFSINGQHGTKVFVPAWIATGTLSTGFEGSATVTFNPPDEAATLQLFVVSGAAVDKHIDVASGSGNLFTASGGAEKVIFRPFDATDTDFLFSISGSAGVKLRDFVWVSPIVEYDPYEYVINDEYIIPDFIKFKTSFVWDNVNNVYRALSAESITLARDVSGTATVAGNVGTRVFVPNWIGSGSISITGAVVDKHIDTASGSGNLFAASGASESVGANPPDDTQIFFVTGSATEKHVDISSGSGSATFSGTAVEKQTEVAIPGSGEALFGDGSATIQIIRYNVFGGLISFSQSATASVTYNPQEFDPLFTVTGSATQSETNITSGSGSITTDVSATSRVVFNPADTEQLFEVTGAYSNLKSTSAWVATGTITVTGTVVDKHIDAASGSGTITFTGAATDSQTDIASGSGTYTFAGEANDLYIKGAEQFGGTLFIVDGGSARVTFNPSEGNQLFDVSGTYSNFKITDAYNATGSATLEGTLGSRIFVPNWIGSGTITVTGESTQKDVNITSGSGALFTDGFYSNLKATFRSVSAVGLFDITGTVVDKHVEVASGSGTSTITGAATDSQTDITSGSGTLFSGGLYSNLRVTFNPTEDPALFFIVGSSSDKQTYKETGSGSVTLTGTLVEKHIDVASGSGSIAAGFNASASVTFRPFDATDTDSLFSILGSAIEKNTESYVGSGTATFSGTAAESQRNITSGSGALFTDGFFSNLKATFRPFDATDLDPLFSINGSAVEKNTESYVGTGSGVFTGDVVQKHIDIASGSGNLFSASGAAEAIGINPPDDTALFDISGDASLRYFARNIGSGSITTSFGGTASVTFNPPEFDPLFTINGTYSNLKFISANNVSGSTTFSGTVAEKHIDVASGSGSTTFSGTAAESQRNITSGSGSLFAASGAAESVGVNPPDDIALFTVSGTYSNLKFISANNVSGSTTFSGTVVEKFTDAFVGSGTATFSGTASEKQTDITSGSGSLFTTSGASESIGTNPPDDIALFFVDGTYSNLKFTSDFAGSGTLFTVSGAAEKVTFNPPDDTQLFLVTGTSSQTQRNVALPGSGSLFTAFGGTASVTFNPPEFDPLFTINGTYSNFRFLSALVGSGSATFSGTVVEKFTDAFDGSGSATFSGTVSEKQTDITSGSGTLFYASGAAEAFGVNPQEDTALFNVGGTYSNLKFTNKYTASGTFSAFSGSVVAITVSASGTGLFNITDTATKSVTYKSIDGTGSLFGFSGAVQSVTFNPVDTTQLFEVSGQVSVTTSFGYGGGDLVLTGTGQAEFRRGIIPEQGSGEIVSSGDTSYKKVIAPYIGSGSLFAASGSAQATTNVPPIDPIIWEDDLRTTLYLVKGSASVTRTASIDNDVTINISGSGIARTVLPERIFAAIV